MDVIEKSMSRRQRKWRRRRRREISLIIFD